MISMKQLGLILLLLMTSISSAQDQEYIVTKANDTIYGKVTRRTSTLDPSIISFKIKTSTGRKQIFRASEVKLIRSLKGIDGDCFIETARDIWFIKRIVDGKIIVYQAIAAIIYFVSKEGSPLKAIDMGGFSSRKKPHAQIRPYLEDQPEVLKAFDGLNGSVKNILYSIEEYNKAAASL